MLGITLANRNTDAWPTVGSATWNKGDDGDNIDGLMVWAHNPTETTLLRDARAAGCQTIGGLDMLVAQAVEQFSWWTGIRPDPEVMRAAALAQLTEFNVS